MKILYVFDSQDHEVFKMADLPDRFEIIREGKKPIVFKPAAIQMQDLYARLNETEEILQHAFVEGSSDSLNLAYKEYLMRYSQ